MSDFDGESCSPLAGFAGISLGARVLAVANDYDGLQIGIVAPRRLSPEDARKMIASGRGKRYDPTVVDAFLAGAQVAPSEVRPRPRCRWPASSRAWCLLAERPGIPAKA